MGLSAGGARVRRLSVGFVFEGVCSGGGLKRLDFEGVVDGRTLGRSVELHPYRMF